MMMYDSSSPYLDTIETSSESPDLWSEKLQNYAHYKKLSMSIAAALVYGGSLPVAEKLQREEIDLASFFNRGILIDECGGLLAADDNGSVVWANYCNQRLCPQCQRRKSIKQGDLLRKVVEISEGKWLHLVVTVPNCDGDNLSHTLNEMQSAFRMFINLPTVKLAFLGILRCTEVSYNYDNGTYHPHFHCLVNVADGYFSGACYLSVEKIRALWTGCYRWMHDRDKYSYSEFIDFVTALSSCFQCYIRKFDECDIEKSVAEVAKYAVKPLLIDLPSDELIFPLTDIFVALHRRRLTQSFGSLRKLIATAKNLLQCDCDEPEDKEVKLYRYSLKSRSYEPTDENLTLFGLLNREPEIGGEL